MTIGNPSRLADYIIIPFNLQEIGIYSMPLLGNKDVIADCDLIGIVQLHREELYLAHGKSLTDDLNKLIIKHYYPTYPEGDSPQRLTEKVLVEAPDLKGRFIK